MSSNTMGAANAIPKRHIIHGEPTPTTAETFARDYISALYELTDEEAFESIMITRRLLAERFSERVESLKNEAARCSKQSDYVYSLLEKL